MNVVVVIQARMGSTRLPGKALLDVGGRPVLEHVVRRCQAAQRVDAVVVATTSDPADDALDALANRLGAGIVRGSVDDVLDRYHAAAAAYTAGYIVRVTGDCPFIDPAFIDACVDVCRTGHYDYMANDGKGYMRGFDVEVMTRAALDTAWQEAQAPFERTHVTPFLYQHPQRFSLYHMDWPGAPAEQRLPLDTEADLHVLRAVADHFGSMDNVSWRAIVDYLDRHPDLAAMNRHIHQKDLAEG